MNQPKKKKHKTKRRQYINHWTQRKESKIKEWQEQCRIFVWLHSKTSDYYEHMNKCLMIPSILITAITSTTLFSTLGMDDTDAIIIVFGTLLVVGTILQSIKDLFNPGQLAIKNSNIAKQYTTLLSL